MDKFILRKSGIRENFIIQCRVFSALAARYLVGRYGRENIGFIWLVVEPMLLCVGVMVVWSSIKSPYEHGVGLLPFLLTGYMPLTLWRHLTGHSINILRSIQGLRVHKQITFLDWFIIRMFMEFVGSTAALLTIFLLLYSLNLIAVPYDIHIMIEGWFLMFFLGVGFGSIAAALSEVSELVEKVNGPIQYLILPISGCFFMVGWLPSYARELVVYIPMVNAYEAFRAGYLGPSFVTYYSLSYGFIVSVIALGFGLVGMRIVEDHVQR